MGKARAVPLGTRQPKAPRVPIPRDRTARTVEPASDIVTAPGVDLDLPLAPILVRKLRNMHPQQLATILTEQDSNE